MEPKSALFWGLVWILKLAVRTNWPTVAEKPERKALKGYMSWLAGEEECDEGAWAYVVSTNDTVEELKNADQDEEGHEDVNQLDTLRSILNIAVPHSQSDLLSIWRVADSGLDRGGLHRRGNGLGRLRWSRCLSVGRLGGRRGDNWGRRRSGGVLLGSHDQGVEPGNVSCGYGMDENVFCVGWRIRWSGRDSRFKKRQAIIVGGGMLLDSNCRRAATRMARLLKLAGMLARTVPRHNLWSSISLSPPTLPTSYPLIYLLLRHFLTLARTTPVHSNKMVINAWHDSWPIAGFTNA
jgi:hypothetical protein